MMICAESLQLQMRRSTLDRSLHQRVFHGCVPAAVSPRTHQRASTPSPAHWPAHSRAHSLTDSLTHSRTHSRTHSLTRELTFGLTEAAPVGVSTFFSASTIYILLLIFSPDHLYSREYSRISRIFLSLGRSTEAKNRPNIRLPPQNRLGTLKT